MSQVDYEIDIRHGEWNTVLSDVTADLIFTSPPYNIGSKAPRSDGNRSKGKFDRKSYGGITGYPDTLPEEEYQQQQVEFFLWAEKHLSDNGTLVYNHKPRRVKGAMIHPAAWFLRPEVTRAMTLMEEVIWDRGSTHNHSRKLMYPTTERLYVFRRAGGKYALDNTSDLPERSDVWRINRPSTTGGHACPYSNRLAEAVIKAWSKPGDVVCDPYTGSGTTAIAAASLGRRFVGSEREKKYHKLAVERVNAAGKAG